MHFPHIFQINRIIKSFLFRIFEAYEKSKFTFRYASCNVVRQPKSIKINWLQLRISIITHIKI